MILLAAIGGLWVFSRVILWGYVCVKTLWEMIFKDQGYWAFERQWFGFVLIEKGKAAGGFKAYYSFPKWTPADRKYVARQRALWDEQDAEDAAAALAAT